MQYGSVIFVRCRRGVDAGQMIAIEDYSDWLIHGIELV